MPKIAMGWMPLLLALWNRPAGRTLDYWTSQQAITGERTNFKNQFFPFNAIKDATARSLGKPYHNSILLNMATYLMELIGCQRFGLVPSPVASTDICGSVCVGAVLQ